MPLPHNTEYNEAIQNPFSCFQDPELRQGDPETDPIGLPRPRAGNFADVYRIHCPATGNTWAVKCFTREVRDLQDRYQAIHAHLRRYELPFMVDFQYQPQGIRVRGRWYPMLKMRWIEGFTLNEFLRDHVDKPALLERLAQMWIRLSQELRRAGIAHGDLQHGNVLLVPGSRAAALGLRLIDYDGMYVPTLFDLPSGELGHPNYQHPQRLREGTYNAELDRFSHLAIYTALRCLIIGGRELWERYDTSENLLFREQDFSSPKTSELLRELSHLDDAWVRTLLGHLVLASQGTLEQAPLLEDLVGADGRPLFLTAAQERQLRNLMPPGSAQLRPAQKLVLALPGNGSPEPESEEAGPGQGLADADAVGPTSRPVPPLLQPEADLHLIPPEAIQVLDREPDQPLSRLERWLHLAVAAAAVFLAVALTLIVLRLGARYQLRERPTPPPSPPPLEAPAIEASRQPPLHPPPSGGQMPRE